MNMCEGRTQRAHHQLEQADFGVIEKLIKTKKGQQCESRKGGWFWPLSRVSEQRKQKYGRGK